MNGSVSNTIWIWIGIWTKLVYLKKNSKDPIDVGVFLAENNYPPIFDGIDFSAMKDLENLHFKDLIFSNCNFLAATFSKTYFSGINAKNCTFEKTNWDHVTLQNCLFDRCKFSGLRMYRSEVSTIFFLNSKFLQSHFQNSLFLDTVFFRCNLKETDVVRSSFQGSFFSSCALSHSSWYKCDLEAVNVLHGKFDGACFWKNTYRNYSLAECDLAECFMAENSGDPIFQNCSHPQLTRPVIAMAWDFNIRAEYSPIVAHAIRDSGAIPLKIEVEPNELSSELLQQEVSSLIFDIGHKYPKDILSIPSEILKLNSEDSEISKIKSMVSLALQFCSGVSLPGGSDLQPEFYGAKKDPRTDYVKDCRRSIVEFSLLFYADQLKLPTMGTCRGAQLINVFFGGTLNQHVEGQATVDHLQLVHLSESSRKDEFFSYFGSNSLPSFSIHHQVIDKVGENLEVIYEFEGIPKLLLSPDNQYIASQIHPEMYAEIGILDEKFKPARCGGLIYRFFLKKVFQFHENSSIDLKI